MNTANRVKKILNVGDEIYSTNGKKMKVISKDYFGFKTEEDYFTYEEHRDLYFLTYAGLKGARK